MDFAAYRRHITAQTRTRMWGFLHIANIGLPTSICLSGAADATSLT